MCFFSMKSKYENINHIDIANFGILTHVIQGVTFLQQN